MNSNLYRALSFRLRVLLFWIPLSLGILYCRWIAPLVGPKHVLWVRVALPRRLSQIFLWLYGVRVHLTGYQQLQGSSGTSRVLMVNHNSRFDAYILLATLDFPFKAFWSNTAHVTTEGFPILSRFGRVFDLFFVHDKSDKRKTLEQFNLATQYVVDGGTLSMFPEGAYSPDGTVRGFGTACTSLAIKAGASIFPLVMSGTEAVFERRRRGRRVVDVHLRFLAPIATADRARNEAQALTREIECEMNQALVDLRQLESSRRS